MFFVQNIESNENGVRYYYVCDTNDGVIEAYTEKELLSLYRDLVANQQYIVGIVFVDGTYDLDCFKSRVFREGFSITYSCTDKRSDGTYLVTRHVNLSDKVYGYYTFDEATAVIEDLDYTKCILANSFSWLRFTINIQLLSELNSALYGKLSVDYFRATKIRL